MLKTRLEKLEAILGEKKRDWVGYTIVDQLDFEFADEEEWWKFVKMYAQERYNRTRSPLGGMTINADAVRQKEQEWGLKFNGRPVSKRKDIGAQFSMVNVPIKG